MPGGGARGQNLVHESKTNRIFVLKFSRSLYFGNHLPESIHTWTIGTH